MVFRSKFFLIKDFIFSRIYLEIIILCIVFGIIAAGFLALKYFQTKIDYLAQSQVEGAKTQSVTPAEDYFADTIGPCGFKHVPDQTAKKSECAKAVECEILSGKWGLFLSKDDCISAQKAALAQQTQNQTAAVPSPSTAPSSSPEPAQSPEPIATPSVE